MNEAPPRFVRPVTVQPEALQFEPFRNLRQTHGFCCGDDSLDDFITTTEVETYQRLSLGYTTLAYLQGELVGFYTVSMDALRFDHLKKRRPLRESNYLELEVYPALKIGRLAVDQRFQGRGIGRLLMDRIVRFALGQPAACRLLVLNARPDSVPFYEKYGFTLSDHRTQRGRRERLMFFDLDYVRRL